MEPDVRLHRWLFDAAPRLTRLENQTLRHVGPGLTFRQYRILCRVDEGNRTVTAIGRLATLSLPAISESTEGLVRKGLLEREVDVSDRRSAQLTLTAEGRRAMLEADAVLNTLAEELVADLDADELEELERAISKVAAKVADRLRAGVGRGPGAF